MIEVYYTQCVIHAEFVRLMLGKHGIHCTLEPDNGDRIFVESKDAKKALDILADWRAGILTADDEDWENQ